MPPYADIPSKDTMSSMSKGSENFIMLSCWHPWKDGLEKTLAKRSLWSSHYHGHQPWPS